MEFAHPVDAHYSCSSLLGWPQLLVTVWQTDDLDRHEIGAQLLHFGPLQWLPSVKVFWDVHTDHAIKDCLCAVAFFALQRATE